MPFVQSGSKVLVSGANGFIPIWVVRMLLEQGFAVRGTVRSLSKGEHLLKMFEKYGERLELIVVPDIEGAFDEAVQGVDAIEHMASPYHYNAEDPDDLIKPAVRGTLNILESALKFGHSVKRIVITSSTAAVVRPTEKPTVFDEKDWNEFAISVVKEQGRQAPNKLKYFASKTLAEKAAFDFYEKHKQSVSWDLVTIAPPYVFGPMIHEVNSLSALNNSLAELRDALFKNIPDYKMLGAEGYTWVDVRDLALAHVRAIRREQAVGRIIVSASAYKWHDFLTAARSLSPNPYPLDVYSPTDPLYNPNQAVQMTDFDTSKSAKVLGMTSESFFTIKQSIEDMLEDWKAKGW
ncbi:NAD(P)-binding protein [Obba rivulosa]|uniref:NAD(P)-binding protein n=1 Tax=Obba rivulosa TaxID=1052685 RepID=A0A8E2DI72_9APHY|nr:NAD(P)-binding protein [Obba rivulosa]